MAIDTFTDANDTLLDTHDPKWDQAVAGLASLEIISNQCTLTGVWAEGWAFYNDSQPADPQTSQIVFKATAAARNLHARVAVRMASASKGYELLFIAASGANYTTVQIYKNGAWQATLTSSGAFPWASDHTMKIIASGGATTTLQGFIDGSQVGSNQTDSSSPITTGNPGFGISDQSGTNTVSVDDWTDGITAGLSIPVAMRTYRQMRS